MERNDGDFCACLRAFGANAWSSQFSVRTDRAGAEGGRSAVPGRGARASRGIKGSAQGCNIGGAGMQAGG